MSFTIGPYRDRLLRLKDVQQYLKNPDALNQEELTMSHTTPTDTPALTFVHNGTPDGGDLHIVVDLEEAKKFTEAQRRESEYDHDSIKVDTADILGHNTCTLTLPYNIIRDFVLDQLRKREIAALESLDVTELANYYVGLGNKNESDGTA